MWSQTTRRQWSQRHLVGLLDIACQLAEIAKDGLKALKVVKTLPECLHPKLLRICILMIASWLSH